MHRTFSGYYRLQEEDLRTLWRQGVFVLDGSVLLNLYRYPELAREAVLGLLQQLSHRLWIPHQAAVTFHDGRVTFFTEQVEIFRRLRDEVERVYTAFDVGLTNASMHSNPAIRGLKQRLRGLTKRLEELEGKRLNLVGGDDLQQRIDALLEGRIGPAPRSQSALKRLSVEAEQRREHRRPPAWEGDTPASQADPYLINGRSLERCDGPFLLWQQIVQQAQNGEHFKDLIFVNDVINPGWWLCDARGERVIGPRPELVEEITAAGCARRFHMYNSVGLLQEADTYLDIKISSDLIAEIRAVLWSAC